jgi:hypothetical protein
VSVLARMPKDIAKHPTYYGTLRFHISYADGKPAGVKEALICVQNKQVIGKPVMDATVLTISETGPSRYQASASCKNAGETYVTELTCQGVLSLVGGGGGAASILKRFLMSSEAYGQTGLLLPVDSRTFSGVLDLSEVPEGDYYVTSVLRYPGCPVAEGLQQQIVIHVSEQGGRKYARMIGAAPGGRQVIKVQ